MPAASFTNLRVFIEETVHPIYSELTTRAFDKAEDIPFIKMPDLFVAAACIGAKENIYKELNSKRDIFVADAFDSRIQIPILFVLAHKKQSNIDELSDAKRILEICQCWANGGIDLIQERLINGKGLRPLYRLIDLIINE
jgi:hypothetical protein